MVKPNFNHSASAATHITQTESKNVIIAMPTPNYNLSD